jgi:hypothetical protein
MAGPEASSEIEALIKNIKSLGRRIISLSPSIPDEAALFAWLDERRFRELAKADAGHRLERAIMFLREELGPDGRFDRALGAVQRAADQISSAYA